MRVITIAVSATLCLIYFLKVTWYYEAPYEKI